MLPEPEGQVAALRGLSTSARLSAARTGGPRPAKRLREGVHLAATLGAFGLAGCGNEEIAPGEPGRSRLSPTRRADRKRAARGELAAEAMRSKAIAQTLFVTIMTVEVYAPEPGPSQARRSLPRAA
jgi:hypothetical protein